MRQPFAVLGLSDVLQGQRHGSGSPCRVGSFAWASVFRCACRTSRTRLRRRPASNGPGDKCEVWPRAACVALCCTVEPAGTGPPSVIWPLSFGWGCQSHALVDGSVPRTGRRVSPTHWSTGQSHALVDGSVPRTGRRVSPTHWSTGQSHALVDGGRGMPPCRVRLRPDCGQVGHAAGESGVGCAKARRCTILRRGAPAEGLPGTKKLQ